MGIAYSHDAKTDVTTWVWDGAVTTEEWVEQAKAQIAEPFWPVRGNLSDLTTADMSAISDEDIAAVAGLYTEQGGRAAGVQLAIIADRNFPRARMFESAVEPAGQRVIVFTDVSAGCTWLGIDIGETLTTIRRLRDELRSSFSAGG
jgi:hypothetical protein